MQTRILIIEPSPTLRLLLSLSFITAGHKVVSYATSQEAVDFLDRLDRSALPQTIFLAIDEGQDAYHVIRYLHAHPGYETVCLVVMVQPEDQPQVAEDIRILRANKQYLTKPFTIEAALALASRPVENMSCSAEKGTSYV